MLLGKLDLFYKKSFTKDYVYFVSIFCTLFLIHFIWNCIFYPGFIQADHQSLIAGIAIGRPNQWHSLLWGYVAYPFLYLSSSYGLYGFVQTIIFALSVSYSIFILFKYSIISSKQGYILALFFCFSPTFIVYNQLYASDVVFSYLIAPLTACVIVIVKTKSTIFSNNRFCVFLILLIVVVVQLRKNALLIPFLLFILIFIYYKEFRLKVFGLFTCIAVLTFLFNAFWSSVLAAPASPSQEMLSVPSVQIARVFVDGGDVPQDISKDLLQIRSEKEWKDAYVSYSADGEKKGLHLTPELMKDWLILGIKNPSSYLAAYSDLLHPFWQLTGQNMEVWGPGLDFAKHDIFTSKPCANLCDSSYVSQIEAPYTYWQTKLSSMQDIVNNSHAFVITDALYLFFFNRALPLWIFIAGFLYSLVKRGLKEYILVSSSLFCILVSLLCFAPISSFRYSFQAFTCIPFVFVFLLYLKKATNE